MIEEKKRKILSDDDWIDYPKYKNSIEKLIEKKYPNGAPNDVIAKALMMSEEEVEEVYQGVIEKLRSKLI